MKLIEMRYSFFFFGFVFFLSSCDRTNKQMELVKASHSGIYFKNTLAETPEFNIFNYMYFYNGGGVAVGDVNNDGLQDIYFTANQLPNKLYLNEGGLKFKDISEPSGVTGNNGWTTGVTMADVNADGKLDIYVCYLGDYRHLKGHNLLFVNLGNDEKGIPTFSEQSAEYGLDLVGFSTQAAFLDYDRDGDLDMFMLNHSLHQNGTFGNSTMRHETHPLSGDKLMRNDNGRYVDATKGSGIFSSVLGYGLGVVVSDVNLDGWPDIYVGNDFHENDFLYINQQNGTFKDVLESSMQQTSRYTMGVDFADFNNDGFPDLIAADMLPADPKILKASQAEEVYDVFDFKLGFGYNYQYSRNVLQLNQRNGVFSEIGRMAGVYATDWSWSALWADMDLDGRKDIVISNGISRRSNDLDYINFITADSIQMRLNGEMTEKELELIETMPRIKIPNFMFINNGDSTFSNKSKEWGLDIETYSNGTAYADLDNDGDLDLVVNNIDDEAMLFENKTLDVKLKSDKAFLKVVLKGANSNLFGVGAKVLVWQKGNMQMQESFPTRGYQSAVDVRLNFGVMPGMIDSIQVVWPSDRFETIRGINSNKLVEVKEKNAGGQFDYGLFHSQQKILVDISSEIKIAYKHRENKHVEFNREGLMPHMVSAEGPAIAVGDIDGNGTDDVFLGGGKWQEARLFIQKIDGSFIRSNQVEIEQDSVMEDVDATFVDFDKDSDLDLFVVSGGNEFASGSRETQPRLYINDGRGLFKKSSGLVPNLEFTHSCVLPSDIDRDGDMDLFIGSRAIPWNYGIVPNSYLLLNDGKGSFSISKQDGLIQLGMVKGGAWIDIDNDQDEDLVVASEWQPITILANNGGLLEKVNAEKAGLTNTFGWWNVVAPSDINGDGRVDFIVGNLGLNSKLKATSQYPIQMYVSDFDSNGTVEQVVTQYIDGVEYPLNTRDELTKQMPSLKKKFLSYKKFAQATFKDVFTSDQIGKAKKFVANEFRTVWVENLGENRFAVHPMPRAVQIAPVNALLVKDFNNDGSDDFYAVGNFYPNNIQLGRYDALYGTILLNNKSKIQALSLDQVGVALTGETRRLKEIRVNGRHCIIAARNNDSVKLFSLNK